MVHSVPRTRRLEREAQRNVELIWLTGRLAPDFKTIADFRKDNDEAIRLVCREFVMLCRKPHLPSDTLAIDGSKFKAVNNAHEITNIGIDRRQLSPMAIKAKEVLEADEPIKVIADQGCYRGEKLLACKEVNITAYVAKSDTSGKRRKGEFSRRQFRYIAKDDEYECPAGERAIYRFTRNEAG